MPRREERKIMKFYTQRQLKEMRATDLTNADHDKVQKLASRCEQIGYSYGIYGINGGLWTNPETGELFKITMRSPNLFIMA